MYLKKSLKLREKGKKRYKVGKAGSYKDAAAYFTFKQAVKFKNHSIGLLVYRLECNFSD